MRVGEHYIFGEKSKDEHFVDEKVIKTKRDKKCTRFEIQTQKSTLLYRHEGEEEEEKF